MLLLFSSTVETYIKHDKHKKGFTHSFVLPEAVPPEGCHHECSVITIVIKSEKSMCEKYEIK